MEYTKFHIGVRDLFQVIAGKKIRPIFTGQALRNADNVSRENNRQFANTAR